MAPMEGVNNQEKSLPPRIPSGGVRMTRKEFETELMGGKSGLIYLVRAAVDEVNWEHKDDYFSARPELRFRSRDLMELLVYGYSRGVYASEDVLRAIEEERLFRGMFATSRPDRHTLVKYRRGHREQIKACLGIIFEQAFAARFGEGEERAVPIDYCVARALDRWFEPICGPAPAAEADERVDRAIFWDGMTQPE